MRTSLLSGIAAGFILLVATACGGSTGSTTPAPQASAATGGAPTCAAGVGTGQQVTAVDIQFNPGAVTANAGGTVSWTNGDSVTHTVTFDNGPDCGNLVAASSLTVTFPAAGTYAYHCTIHPTMRGTVTVS